MTPAPVVHSYTNVSSKLFTYPVQEQESKAKSVTGLHSKPQRRSSGPLSCHSKWLIVSPSGHSKNSCPSKSFAHSISAAQEETRTRTKTSRDIFRSFADVS